MKTRRWVDVGGGANESKVVNCFPRREEAATHHVTLRLRPGQGRR